MKIKFEKFTKTAEEVDIVFPLYRMDDFGDDSAPFDVYSKVEYDEVTKEFTKTEITIEMKCLNWDQYESITHKKYFDYDFPYEASHNTKDLLCNSSKLEFDGAYQKFKRTLTCE
jgi:hypothetical protein